MIGTKKWYLGTILDVAAGTDNWYKVKYDDKEQILSLDLLLDVEKGDLEFIDSDFISSNFLLLFVYKRTF